MSSNTAWKESKYGVVSGPYFPVFGLNTERFMRENTDQNKLRIRRLFKRVTTNTACNYILKVNDRNTRTRCEICSKLTEKTPER